MEMARVAKEKAIADETQRHLPDGHVHTEGGEDIDVVTGKSIEIEFHPLRE